MQPIRRIASNDNLSKFKGIKVLTYEFKATPIVKVYTITNIENNCKYRLLANLPNECSGTHIQHMHVYKNKWFIKWF